MGDLAKCISLGGPNLTSYWYCPQTYYKHGWNRDFIHNSGTPIVKIWVSMNELLGNYPPSGWNPPNSQQGMYNQLQLVPAANNTLALHHLDDVIRQANADHVAVILTVANDYPTWATGTTSNEKGTNKPPTQHVPADVTGSGYYAQFLGCLCRRYQPRGGANPEISALEALNEPNWYAWPQDPSQSNNATSFSAQAMKDAEEAAYFWWVNSGGYGPPKNWPPITILGPATNDYGRSVTNGVLSRTAYDTFTNGVAGALASWLPRVAVGWSHHNYADVDSPSNPLRARNVLHILGAHGWGNWPGGNHAVWLTEGASLLTGTYAHDPRATELSEQTVQANRVVANYAAMRTLTDPTYPSYQIVQWTQHSIVGDPGNPGFNPSIQDDFWWTCPDPSAGIQEPCFAGQPGYPRELWNRWGNQSYFPSPWPVPNAGNYDPPLPDT